MSNNVVLINWKARGVQFKKVLLILAIAFLPLLSLFISAQIIYASMSDAKLQHTEIHTHTPQKLAELPTSTDSSGIVSDDFNDGTINSSLWTFVNPFGDGSALLNGTELLLSVPAGVEHDLNPQNNASVRLMQPANNTDFEIEAKFASSVNMKYQIQGILIEESADKFLGLDFYGNGTITHVNVTTFDNEVATLILDEIIGGVVAPLFMRVTRVGDEWSVWTSLNGADWELAVSFPYSLVVSQVGVYAGNATGATSPAHTAVIDYFFNTASPIDPEDVNTHPLTLTTSTVGQGSITRNPNETDFAYGDTVTLTATAQSGWYFNGWSGAIDEVDNPVAVTMDTDKTVVATFVEDSTVMYELSKTLVGNGEIIAQPKQVKYEPGKVVTLTATAGQKSDFSAWSGAVISTTNPVSLTMDSNKSITATFLLDDVGPVISNVQIITSSTKAFISWTTDEPATSSVVYGLTDSYGLGPVVNPSLVVTHSITLTGLSSNTTYHFQITSQDKHENSTSTADASFITAVPTLSNIVSDDFNTKTISNTLWTFVDPVGDSSASQNGNQLLISVPAGTAHNPGVSGNNSARLMQTVINGDFEVDVKLESDLNQDLQMQGILVEQGVDKYLLFDFYSDGEDILVFAAVFGEGATTLFFDEVVAEHYPQPMYLRLKRVDDDWSFYYSNDGLTWIAAGDETYSYSLTMTGIGVHAANAGETPPALTMVVDYFFNTASPIIPEDPISYLDKNTVGNGSIIVNPDKETYDANEVITVTAVPASGWLFNNWSGSITGATATKTFAMDSSKVITATFIDETTLTYNLNINKVGNGSVTVSPEKVSYLHGDIVTVTAVPGTNWQFAGWSGASSSTSSSIQVTMNGNKSLTATFTPQTFTVTKATIGNGTVTVVPNLPNYTYGQVITITAHAANGWVFDSWSGLSSNTNPQTVVVTSNLAITAVFEEVEVEDYFVFLPTVIKP